MHKKNYFLPLSVFEKFLSPNIAQKVANDVQKDPFKKSLIIFTLFTSKMAQKVSNDAQMNHLKDNDNFFTFQSKIIAF